MYRSANNRFVQGYRYNGVVSMLLLGKVSRDDWSYDVQICFTCAGIKMHLGNVSSNDSLSIFCFCMYNENSFAD